MVYVFVHTFKTMNEYDYVYSYDLKQTKLKHTQT